MQLTSVIDKLEQKTMRLVNADELHDWIFENIDLVSYIPIAKKYAIIHNITEEVKSAINTLTDNGADAETLYMLVDLLHMKYIVLAYTDIDIKNISMTPEYYDIIKESGFYSIIKKIGGEDLLEFSEMYRIASGVYDFNMMNIIAASVNDMIKPEDVENVKNVFNELSEEKMAIIKDIVAFNNPAVANMYTQMQNAAMENADKVMKEKVKTSTSSLDG